MDVEIPVSSEIVETDETQVILGLEQNRKKFFNPYNPYLTQEVIEKECTCAGILIVKNVILETFENLRSISSYEILLVESKRKSYQYSFPKGKRNRDEDTITTAKRELTEETGLTEEDYILYPNIRYVEYRPDLKKPHIVYYLARLTNLSAQLVPQDTREIVSANWFTPQFIYKMRKSFYLQRRQIVTRAMKDINRIIEKGEHHFRNTVTRGAYTPFVVYENK